MGQTFPHTHIMEDIHNLYIYIYIFYLIYKIKVIYFFLLSVILFKYIPDNIPCLYCGHNGRDRTVGGFTNTYVYLH